MTMKHILLLSVVLTLALVPAFGQRDARSVVKASTTRLLAFRELELGYEHRLNANLSIEVTAAMFLHKNKDAAPYEPGTVEYINRVGTRSLLLFPLSLLLSSGDPLFERHIWVNDYRRGGSGSVSLRRYFPKHSSGPLKGLYVSGGLFYSSFQFEQQERVFERSEPYLESYLSWLLYVIEQEVKETVREPELQRQSGIGLRAGGGVQFALFGPVRLDCHFETGIQFTSQKREANVSEYEGASAIYNRTFWWPNLRLCVAL